MKTLHFKNNIEHLLKKMDTTNMEFQKICLEFQKIQDGFYCYPIFGENLRKLDPDNEKNTKWGSPEINTKKGVQAKEALDEMIGDNIVIFIPSKHPVNLKDVNSFNRVLAHVYDEYDGKNLAKEMENLGYASKNQKSKNPTQEN